MARTSVGRPKMSSLGEARTGFFAQEIFIITFATVARLPRTGLETVCQYRKFLHLYLMERSCFFRLSLLRKGSKEVSPPVRTDASFSSKVTREQVCPKTVLKTNLSQFTDFLVS